MVVIHKCDKFPNDLPTKVDIDLNLNWANGIDIPEQSFAIYKSCCHFYKINDDGTQGEEIDCKKRKPVLIFE